MAKAEGIRTRLSPPLRAARVGGKIERLFGLPNAWLSEHCHQRFHRRDFDVFRWIDDSGAHVSHTLLIVDDDRDMRELLAEALRDEGLRVLLAGNGEEGMEQFRLHRPDLLILDVEMPLMSGIELCRQIRASSDVPILFLSGRADVDDRLAGLEGGGDDYLTKPADPRELIIKVRRMLKRTTKPPALEPSDADHCCAVCSTAVKAAYGACPECGAEPPESGWLPISQTAYQYLGCIVNGRYVLDQYIGSGAVGQVYRAWERSIERHFACKIVDTRGFSNPAQAEEVLRGFRLEAETMTRLHNPHVVALHDTTELVSGVFALLMDFVRGRTLQELLDIVGHMTPHAALELTRQIANGLHEAHQAGLIHRDLKPANIMVERLPATGFFARILDFGIAYRAGEPREVDGFRGTPLYASPEQVRGETIDSRSDIYSLGCVLFHCLTGDPPFPGRKQLEVMNAHLRDPAPTLTERTETTFPEPLERLVGSLLAKSREGRPNSLEEVIRAIDTVLEGSYGAGISQEFDVLAGGRATVNEVATTEAPADAYRTQLTTLVAESKLPMPESVVDDWALDDRGQHAVVSIGNQLQLLTLRSDRFRTTPGIPGTVKSLAFTSDGEGVVICSGDGKVSLHPTRTGEPALAVASLARPATAMADASGTLHAATGAGLIRIEPTGHVRELAPWEEVTTLAVDPHGEVILAGHQSGALSLLHPGEETIRLRSMNGPIRSIAVSPDGHLAAILDRSRTVRVLSTIEGAVLFTLRAPDEPIEKVAFAPTGALLGASLEKGVVRLYELRCRPADSSAYSVA